MQKFFLVFFICISIWICTYSWWQFQNVAEKEAIYIAVICPMDLENGKSMHNGVQLYVDQVNLSGGIDGRKIKILFYNDENSPSKAKNIAENIASDNKVLFVIGHYYNNTSRAAGKIYKRFQIPAITASATAEDVILNNKWYFRTIPGNHIEASFVAHYIKTGLKKKSAGIIFSKDAYGKLLAETFKKVTAELGVQVDQKWEWDYDKPSDLQLEIIQKQLSEGKVPDVLYCATHAAEGVELITTLKESGLLDQKIDIISSYAVARSFFSKLKGYPQEKSTPGFYSDGIYFATPFLRALGGVRAFEFDSQYQEKYTAKPEIVSRSYYDAVKTAIEAANKSGVQGREYIHEDREKLRNTLAGFYNPQHAVKGAGGLIWFNEEGGVTREYAVGTWQGQKETPANIQFSQQNNKVDDVLEAVLDDQAILIDDLVMSATQIVSVAVQNINITDITMDLSQFTASFQLKFSSPSKSHTNEFLPNSLIAPLEFENAVIPITLSDPVREKSPDGKAITTLQVQATFKTDFNISSFPFNTEQKISIRFRNEEAPYEHLIYVPAIESIALESVPENWRSFNAHFYQDIMSKKTSLGDPEYFRSERASEYSRFNIEFTVIQKKSFLMFCYQTLPLLLTGIAFFMIFRIPAEQWEKRLLRTVALQSLLLVFHLRQHTNMPVGYFTIIDYAYYLFHLILLFSLASYHPFFKKSMNIIRYKLPSLPLMRGNKT
ncbi:ABC-type branched-chain amino acid transport system, substrate-binding protein [Candidatus Electrothrix aarhusensis]|uniref:ABC-type branched-chain amino acid transport system, substrate-binding protein n=1 Tax=Candidatus Electrothrix aarhusensis TaxID=1859131 RepID=A0A3S3QZK1_9BACT|nr:ABC-type branched-chain amino acid transport system, substrate-binding protein [Candidatus Electrothrix aarhusensis]